MKLSAKLPQDDQGAKLIRFEDVRGQRYTEIFLIGGHAITHHLVGGVYNTIGMNDPDGTGDTCPQDVLDKVGIDDLKEAYDLLGAFKNGPRLWCLDDLVLTPDDGTAKITQDDLGNTYDRVGGPYSNYKP